VNLFLRPLTDVNDVTWSIIWMMVILLVGVMYVVYYILGIDKREYGSDETPESEELLQFPSDEHR
jgi:hypothetical protein